MNEKSWIALHGAIGSGKSTLATALAQTHLYVNYTEQLKKKFCAEMNVSLQEIYNRKEYYRPLIQSYGDAIGFTDDPAYIVEALQWWKFLDKPAVVFDNVRSIPQALALRSLGFTIVCLTAPTDVLNKRVPGSAAARSHAIERPLPHRLIDVTLDATLPTSLLVNEVRDL